MKQARGVATRLWLACRLACRGMVLQRRLHVEAQRRVARRNVALAQQQLQAARVELLPQPLVVLVGLPVGPVELHAALTLVCSVPATQV